jgi:hypothetical protein
LADGTGGTHLMLGESEAIARLRVRRE